MTRLAVPDPQLIPVGQSRIIDHPEGNKPYVSVIITQTSKGPRAYWNVCQHVPVPLDSGLGHLPPGDALVCLTHGAQYRASDGECIAGPCSGRTLESVELEHDGQGWWAVV